MELKNQFVTLVIFSCMASCLSTPNHSTELNRNCIDSALHVKATSILENKLSELNALSGQAIIMEVQTGQIKAMIGLERKDSATYRTSENLPQTQTLGLIQPISILAALETGKVKLSDTVDVGNGIYSTNEVEIKDHNWHRGGYGTITIQQGLAVSSEIAAYKTIEKAFGSEQAYQAQLKKMGINLDSLNTLKMLTIYNEIAKNGNIASKANTDSLKQALKYSVTNGLGLSAKSEKVQVAGKTGALQLEDGSYIVEFCGYFPADNPQYSIIVSINKEGLPAAGFMAGEVFRQIVDYMNK